MPEGVSPKEVYRQVIDSDRKTRELLIKTAEALEAGADPQEVADVLYRSADTVQASNRP